MSYTYNIFARTAGVDSVHAGEAYTFRVPRRILYAWPALSDWYEAMIREKLGGTITDPENVYMTLDHMLPVRNQTQERFISESRRWAKEQGFHLSEGEGIGHILAIEQQWVEPGMLVPHFDTHISCIGAIGALGVGCLKEMLRPLTQGLLWMEIPEVVRVGLHGSFQPGVMGRDLLHTLVMELGLSRCSGKILEFGGPGARSMPLATRVTVCNLINYLGCVSAVFDPDADAQTENAYSELIHLDLGCIEPCLAAPPSIANAVPLSKAAGTQIDIGIIGTCAGGGLEDLEAAAHVLSGRRLAPGRKLYISPATAAIQSEAIRRGYYQIFSDAGCFLSSPTCDFCYGAAAYLGAGKRAISTQTLNVSGRLGSLDSEIYLASAAAVAAAAVQGEICDPRDFWKEAEA